jgi:hypothetical protein
MITQACRRVRHTAEHPIEGRAADHVRGVPLIILVPEVEMVYKVASTSMRKSIGMGQGGRTCDESRSQWPSRVSSPG